MHRLLDCRFSLWVAVAAALAIGGLGVDLAHAQPRAVNDAPGQPFAVPIPPPLPSERRAAPDAPVAVAVDDSRPPWTPPLPPIRPGATAEQPRPPTEAAAAPDAGETTILTRRVTEPPPPPAIDTPDPPDDPGWVVRNRPDPVDPPINPTTMVDDVEALDRPEVVEDRPSDPRTPRQDPASNIDAVAESDRDAADAIAWAGMGSVAPWEGSQARILFEGADTAFARNVRAMLEQIAARLGRDETLRLSVLSYAGGAPESAGQARLLSLTRALAVRDFLTDRGIRQARISVRGLGNSAVDGPPDRIDLLLGN